MYRFNTYIAVIMSGLIVSSCVGGIAIEDAELISLNPSSVENNSSGVQRIIYALSKDSTGNQGNSSWYQVAEAGFNYVDGRCDAYFGALYKLQRNQIAAKNSLSSFSQTTSAILAATGASSLSLAVVSQAFGLGGQLVDISANSFLYNLPPDRTMKFVSLLQAAYRGGAYKRQASIDSPMRAYHEVQSYLRLCSPPMIEAEIADLMGGVQAVATTTGDGQSRVVVGTALSASDMAKSLTVLDNSSASIKDPGKPKRYPGLTEYEQILPPERVSLIQDLLCVPKTGVWNAETRTALMAFYEGGGQPRPAIGIQGVNLADITPRIDEALITYKEDLAKKCDGTGADARKYKNAKDLGALIF